MVSLETPEPQAPLPEAESVPAPHAPSLWQRILRWALSVFILIGLGFILALFILYIPMRQNKMQAEDESQKLAHQATAEAATAQAQGNQLATLQAENEMFNHHIEQIELLNLILNLRLDVASAQLALTKEDTDKAHLALNNTANLLDELEKKLPLNQRGVVQSMKVRLDLILQELEKDVYAAQSDLDVLANALLELQNALTQ